MYYVLLAQRVVNYHPTDWDSAVLLAARVRKQNPGASVEIVHLIPSGRS